MSFFLTLLQFQKVELFVVVRHQSQKRTNYGFQFITAHKLPKMKLLSTICLELFRSSSSICFYKWLELLFIFITWTLRYRHLFWIEVFRIEVFRIKVFQIKVFRIKVFRIFFQCWNLKPVDHLFSTQESTCVIA